MSKKIILTGGPGTGKSSLISKLIDDNFICFEEKSRNITAEFKKEGVNQLFLTNPLLFSEKLLEQRISQFKESLKIKNDFIFFDRGIPDIIAYLNFKKNTLNDEFRNACIEYRYDIIFILRPWKKIYKKDLIRYENFDELVKIDKYIYSLYDDLGYTIFEVPTGSLEYRKDFILNTLTNMYEK